MVIFLLTSDLKLFICPADLVDPKGDKTHIETVEREMQPKSRESGKKFILDSSKNILKFHHGEKLIFL